MNITNIKTLPSLLVPQKERPPQREPRKDYGNIDGRSVAYKPPTTNETDFVGRPNALAVRELLASANISHRSASIIVGLPVITMYLWLKPIRVEDCPNYVLQKLKEEIK